MTDNLLDYTGKVALITGGSTGIGSPLASFASGQTFIVDGGQTGH